MRKIIIPATSANLGPGFDCLGLALCCYNTIKFEFMEQGLRIDLEEKDRASIPADRRNLIYRIFCSTLQKLGVSVPGLHMAQTNSIPVVRGLGSSAACVVGGVWMADAYLGAKLSIKEKLELCALEEGHPDNALPAILGGITVGGIEGNTVRYARFPAPEDLRLIMFVPPFTLATNKARSVIPKTVSLQDAVFNLSRASLLTAALATGDLSLLPFAMQDRLHQPARKPLVQGYEEIERIALDHGALSICLSGAGPSMLAFWQGEITALDTIRQKAAEMGWQALPMDVDETGCRME